MKELIFIIRELETGKIVDMRQPGKCDRMNFRLVYSMMRYELVCRADCYSSDLSLSICTINQFDIIVGDQPEIILRTELGSQYTYSK